MVPYTDQKVDGRLAFELFSTDMTFTNGEAEIQKGSFVSDLMSFNLTGDMNFKNADAGPESQRRGPGGIMKTVSCR